MDSFYSGGWETDPPWIFLNERTGRNCAKGSSRKTAWRICAILGMKGKRMATPVTAIVTTSSRPGIIAKFAEAYDLDPGKVLAIVSQTVFKSAGNEPSLTNEETAAALIVCNAYRLNPFTREIYAFRYKGKLLIVVGVDGWSAIVNRQEQLNGIEFEEHFDEKGNIRAVTCKIHRKDCALPVVVTEYTHECRRDTIPWQTMPIRMTRNRAFVQCARIAFSVAGIIDSDEAQTIEGSPEFMTNQTKAIIDGSTSKTEAVKAVIQKLAQGSRKQQDQAPEQKPEPESQPAQEAQQAEPAQTEQPTQEDQPGQTSTSLW